MAGPNVVVEVVSELAPEPYATAFRECLATLEGVSQQARFRVKRGGAGDSDWQMYATIDDGDAARLCRRHLGLPEGARMSHD